MNNNARALFENAEKYGLIEALKPFGRNIKIRIPYSVAFSKVPIDNLELSVRSRNGLMRAGLDTVDKLTAAIMSEQGLEKVRNLGRKSVNEIKTCLLASAYQLLNNREKMLFREEFSTLNPRG